MTKRILVVDDDSGILDFLKVFFEDNGYVVFTASNSQDGLNIAKNKIPDLITLDLDLPDEWGPRFYRKLNKNNETKNIPIIVISGLEGNEHAIPKAVASITKPFDKDKLISIVNNILKN